MYIMADEEITNSVSSLEIKDYYTIFNLHQKSIFLVLVVIITNAIIVQLINSNGIFVSILKNPLIILEFLPTLFIIALVKVPAVSESVYKTFRNRFKVNAASNTKYLTGYLRNVSDYVILGPNKKTVILKLNSDDFYNKLPEDRIQIMSDFNSFIINLNIPAVLRVLNKNLNLNDYFEYMRHNISVEPIPQFYYNNFVKDYTDISKKIPDYDYYIELHFPNSYDDSRIETELNLTVSNMVEYLNLSTDPQLLRGDEIFNYIKSVITGEEYRNIYTVPIITDY